MLVVQLISEIKRAPRDNCTFIKISQNVIYGKTFVLFFKKLRNLVEFCTTTSLMPINK